ncbi:MAG: phasin family protein [Hyphomicrobiales bacterium]|nr:phasin family protein [Hyphomicrobiales bacterium]
MLVVRRSGRVSTKMCDVFGSARLTWAGPACASFSLKQGTEVNAMQEMPQFAEMPESVRNIMKSSIEQAKKAFDTFIAASEKAMSNFESTAPQMSNSGMKAVNEKIAEFTKANANANFRYAMRLADAKQLSEVVELQNAHVREMMDSFTKQMEEMRHVMTEFMKEGAKTMQNMPGMPNFNNN